MALSIGLNINESVYVDNTKVTLIDEDNGELVLLIGDTKVRVSDRKTTELMPDVQVSVGKDTRVGRGHGKSKRILFTAPPRIKIYREAIWKEKQLETENINGDNKNQ